MLKMLLSAGAIAAAPAGSLLSNRQSNAESADPESCGLLDPVDCVDPNIGGIGHLLTSVAPEVQIPHGVAVLSPVVAKDVTDIYLAQRMQGFAMGASIVMASTQRAGDVSLPILSDWDHDHDRVSPYYGSYQLESFAIRVEYTPAAHAAHYRFTFPPHSGGVLAITPIESGSYRAAGASAFIAEEEVQGVRSYVYAEVSRPARILSAVAEASRRSATTGSGSSRLICEFDEPAGAIEIRAGFSYISTDQARRNLNLELGDRAFDSVKAEARNACNAVYKRIRVKGGTERERRIFYTCIYRSCQFMKDITEEGQYRGPFDRTVHLIEGRRFYIEDNLWDTYRTRHPLSIILEPTRHADLLTSYIRMFEESGKMPQFPYMRGDLHYMNGNHAASMFLDSYVKGRRDFDLVKAYEGLRKVATVETVLPDTRGPATDLDRFYYERGYYPALRKGEAETVLGVNPVMRRQAVSVSLDAAYDDWCLSRLAKALGKTDDARYFGARGLNYRNVFDHSIGFVAPKDASGAFIAGFNPKWAGGQGGRDYFTECNGWVNTFIVQHDVAGLIQLIGNREKFIQKLDALFTEGYDGELKFVFLAQYPDSTALIGQYPQGNEPGFHIPYLYCYAGAPWKTQRCVRQIMRTWYADEPLGLPGDDDNGATSAWYVFSAMGFYPVCPGRPYYIIGSPIFEECEIDVGNGNKFRIIAHNVSAVNKYIQSASLNGEALDKPWFEHAALVRGGTLTLHMGPDPNRNWGSSDAAARPRKLEPRWR